MPEDQHLEYKRELNDTLEKEVVAFLNHRDGGQIHIGIEDSGELVGLTDPGGDQLKIKDRLRNNIQPSCLGLFDLVLENNEGKDWLRLIVASGSEKPYYLRKQGMSPRGCFIRVGSAAEPMEQRQIEQLFAIRTRDSIGRIKSPRQDLNFAQLKIYYEGAGRPLGEQFASNLELLTEEGEFNYAAYLLADRNGTSIKVAKYGGTDRVDLIESEEYGTCCLAKATHQVLDRLDLENRTSTRITSKQREEQRLYHPVALREAVINAIIHNDYSYEGVPKFELFADRLEITSTGGIPQGLSESEFFEGYSMPRNKELMRIFRDLDLVEHLGSGMPRILQAYPKSSFRFTENFIRMSFPASGKTSGKTSGKNAATAQETTQKTSDAAQKSSVKSSGGSSGKSKVKNEVKNEVKRKVKTPEQLIDFFRKNPNSTLQDAADALGKSISSMEKVSTQLRKEGKIRYTGPQKGGHWEVLDPDSSD